TASSVARAACRSGCRLFSCSSVSRGFVCARMDMHDAGHAIGQHFAVSLIIGHPWSVRHDGVPCAVWNSDSYITSTRNKLLTLPCGHVTQLSRDDSRGERCATEHDCIFHDDDMLTMTARARPGHVAGWLMLLSLMLPGVTAMAATPVAAETGTPLGKIVALIDAGQFQAAETDIGAALNGAAVSTDRRRALQFQRERMRRIDLDFSLDADQIKTRVREQIPDMSDAEFAAWDAHGLFEHMLIDGRLRYFKRAPSNLFRLSAEAAARRKLPTPFDDAPMETLNRHHRDIRDAALATHRSSVLPRRVRITQSLTVDADSVPAGQTVRAWIPYPRPLPGQQEDIRYVDSEPAAHRIAPASAMQRTVYFEKVAQAGQPTKFSVTYELTLYAQYHAIDADKVMPETITPALAPYVAERPPHVVFSEPMRVFSRQIVGDETNPYRIAQKLFAAVDQIPWAGAREYSTLSNISDYTLHAGHGDCGEQTLLLITLLRMNGIPARWQ